MNELPRSLKVVTVWLLAGVTVFLAVQAWLAEQQRTRFELSGQQLTLRRAADGHYHWPARVNGHAVDFLVDTGATRSALPAGLARALALPAEGPVRSQTAGGTVQGEVVRADVELQGGVRIERLRIVALPALGAPLLGMDVLGKLHWRQADGELIVDLGRGAAAN
jgi:aspartyl protease family protein